MSGLAAYETAGASLRAPAPPISAVALDAGAFLAARRLHAYLVGGAVRDSLLGRDIEDVDIAVETDIPTLAAICGDLALALGGSAFVLDGERGVVRVSLRGGGVIDFNAAPNGILPDLERRDFTINAMAIPFAELLGEASPSLIDPLGGRRDLDARLLRAPRQRAFEDDPLRLLRAPRLAAQLRFSLHPVTRAAIRANAALLPRVAPERVRDELLKTLAAPGAAASVRLLDDLTLLTHILPELDEARDVSQPKEHYWDVFNHCVETVGRVEAILDGAPRSGGGVPDWALELVPSFPAREGYFGGVVSDGQKRSTLVRLSGLLHDIAKPATKVTEQDGRIRFYGHHKVGAEIADDILGRLRFGARGRRFVAAAVRHHLRPRQMSEPGGRPTRRAMFRYYRDAGDAAIATLYLNMADYLAARGPLLAPSEWREHCDLISHILHANFEETRAPRLITGADIMREFALRPGPLVGKLLGVAGEAQAVGEVTNGEGALELVRRTIAEMDAIEINGGDGAAMRDLSDGEDFA